MLPAHQTSVSTRGLLPFFSDSEAGVASLIFQLVSNLPPAFRLLCLSSPHTLSFSSGILSVFLHAKTSLMKNRRKNPHKYSPNLQIPTSLVVLLSDCPHCPRSSYSTHPKGLAELFCFLFNPPLQPCFCPPRSSLTSYHQS